MIKGHAAPFGFFFISSSTVIFWSESISVFIDFVWFQKSQEKQEQIAGDHC
jgi:hypothetical protein